MITLAQHRRGDGNRCILRPVTQQVIHQRQRHHRLGDGGGANADTRIVTSLGHHLDRIALNVDAASGQGDTGGGLERQVSHQWLTRRDPSQHTPGMVGEKALWRQLVTVLTAPLGDHRKAVANLYPLDGVDAHQRMCQVGIQTVKYRLTQSRWYPFGHHGNLCTHRVLVATQLVHESFKLRYPFGVGTEKGILVHRLPVFEINTDGAELTHIATYTDTLGCQVLLGDGTGCDPHGGLPGTGATAAAVVADTIFVMVGIIGVGRTKLILDIAVIPGALIGIFDQQPNRRPRGHTFEHAGKNTHLIGLTALRRVPRRARAAAIEITLQIRLAKRKSRRTAVDNGTQCRAMALAESGDSEKLAESVAGHEEASRYTESMV